MIGDPKHTEFLPELAVMADEKGEYRIVTEEFAKEIDLEYSTLPHGTETLIGRYRLVEVVRMRRNIQ